MCDKCFVCGSEMTPVSSIRAVAYFCEKCDEFYFEKITHTVCEVCNKTINTDSELVLFKDYFTGNIVVSICDECGGG